MNLVKKLYKNMSNKIVLPVKDNELLTQLLDEVNKNQEIKTLGSYAIHGF